MNGYYEPNIESWLYEREFFYLYWNTTCWRCWRSTKCEWKFLSRHRKLLIRSTFWIHKRKASIPAVKAIIFPKEIDFSGKVAYTWNRFENRLLKIIIIDKINQNFVKLSKNKQKRPDFTRLMRAYGDEHKSSMEANY